MRTDELYTIMFKVNMINVHLVFKEMWKSVAKFASILL